MTVLAALLGALPCWAQTAPAAPSARIDGIVVTAASREQPIADVQAAVQVVGERELRTYPGTSVTEALQGAVGVDARPNGANSTIAIRGIVTNAGSPVLVLVDGLRRTAKYAGVNLNLLPLESVERVEIVRGPMSALYGADATGGVVNVITRPITAQDSGHGSLRLTAGQARGGQRETLAGGGTFHLATGPLAHRLSVEQRRRGLFRYDEQAVTADLGEIDERYVDYQGEWRPGEAHRIRWVFESLDQSDTSPGLLAAAPPARPVAQTYEGYEDERRRFGALRYAGEVGPGTLEVDFSSGKSTAATTRAYPVIETTRYRQTDAAARYLVSIGAHALVVGAGATRDDLDISITSRTARRTGHHVLVQDEWRFAPGFTLLAGLRRDQFSDFGSETTPRASVRWGGGPWSVRLGYGRAYRAPSVLEQYSSFLRGRFLIVGNPDLQPETNRTTEVAFGYSTAGLSSEVVLFDSQVGNLVQSVTAPRQAGDPASVQSRSVYANVASAQLSGIEWLTHWQVSRQWRAQVGVDYLNAMDGTTRARLAQRARFNARLGVNWTEGPWQVDLRARFYGDYYNADPLVRASASFDTNYRTTALQVSRAFGPTLTLAAGVDNVFDARQPINWSNTGATMDPPGRFLYVNGRWRF